MGSNPILGTNASIAQLKVQFRPKEKVEGLSPSGSTDIAV